nr:enoyl-CoA hydratase/isomerase family protein [uncultured Sphingomonas sp.]
MFTLDVEDDGVAICTFWRPPVNAVSYSVYEDLQALTEHVAADLTIRVVILAVPEGAKAWCGGADLNDFVGIDQAARKARYARINAILPAFERLDRPVVAAITAPAVGIGVILAALCDMRIAAEDAHFSCPEIRYSLVAGGGGIFRTLNMPEAKAREMLFTGRRFTGAELAPTGFFNYVLPRTEVMPRAIGLAREIAVQSLPALRARKRASVGLEGRSWTEAYLDAQALSAELTGSVDAEEGVAAFLDGREARFQDR